MDGVSRASGDARLLGVVVLALAAGAFGSAAAQDPEYLVEYRAFRAALDAGDKVRATTHAESAWQAAEKALGDDPQTATVAYNYARLVVFDDDDKARDAFRRASDLQEAGIGRLHVEELQLYSAYADFAAGGYGRRRADRLQQRLVAWDTSRNLGSDLIVMWLNLGQAYLAERQYEQAQAAAERTEAAIVETLPDNVHFRAQAVLINGVARLLTRKRTISRIQAAHNEFSRAQRFFPLQEDLDSFDPLLARIIAWNGAAKAALASMGTEDYPDHDDPDFVEPMDYPLFVHQTPGGCGAVEWLNRSAPRFPRTELRRGMIGAVYVGYALGEDLRVQDARVLAEVPESRFGEAALEATTEWRAKSLPPGAPACYRNRVARFTFAIH